MAPVKLFKHTWDGDHVRITFTHEEEKTAFEQALDLVRERILKNQKREETISDFHFDTSLQMDVVRDNLEVFNRISGVKVLNFVGNNKGRESDLFIVPIPVIRTS